MTKATANTVRAAIALAGVLGAIGIKVYAIGWLDDWVAVAGVSLVVIGAIGLWWWRSGARERNDLEAMNRRWESKRAHAESVPVESEAVDPGQEQSSR